MRTFWPQWALFFSVALLQSLNPAALAQDSNLSRDWVSTSWDVWCARANSPDLAPCEGQETAAAVFQAYLESSSQWYESLGFLGPKVVTQFGRYQAQIVLSQDAYDDGEPWSGVYDPNDYWIYLNEDHFFALGEPGDAFDAADFRVEQAAIYTSVHEVFHAIQETYSSFVCGEGRGWICEGMADAALRAYADKFESEMNIAMERRPYHEPLHQPTEEKGGYGTWQFWLDVGSHLNSTDKIRYFRDIMQRNLVSHNGLVGVDHALKDLVVGPDSVFWEENGLYDLLPWFFAKHDPSSLFPQTLRRSIRLEHDQTSAEERITNIVVQPVAGRSIELTINKPADTAVGVRISFGRPNEDLHLIVDNVRYDKVRGENRNVFFAIHREEQELKLDVVIANVAKAAQMTRENKVDLVVELLTEFASMGAGSNSGTPLPPGIDAPLPIELDKFSGYVYPYGYRKSDDKYVGVADGVEGLAEPCVIRFPLLSSTTTGDAVAFEINLSGPLAPGIYNIANGKEHKAAHQVTGQFLASFRIGAGNTLSGGRDTDYWMSSGSVTIHSVRGGLVRGELRGNGVAGPTGLGKEPPNYPQLSVTSEFSIFVTAPMGKPISDQPYACLDEERPDGDHVPPTPASQETGPGTPTEGAQPPADPESPQVAEEEISIRATGPGEPGEWIFGDQDFILTGGCTGSSPMNFGFASGAPHLDDWVYLSFTTEQVVESGALGTFTLSNLTWEQGVERPASLPPESPIRAPRRYEGKGTLRLDRHDNHPTQRRISGSMEGELVRRLTQETVTVSAAFSIPMSCGVDLSAPRD